MPVEDVWLLAAIAATTNHLTEVEQEFPEYIKESPALEVSFDKKLYDYEEKPKVKNPFEGNISKLFMEKVLFFNQD
ncbi:hypothetical protein QYM36_019249 [Artemia franciscana]|uniref:Uncharacterized protein n=1 Tax=Artemia franciscana TaxID=6661 RepID=A0AA88KTX6_ARTSF|nr:hypothetical protein QYM36_019249 [Artemia franciscana]